MVKIEFDEKNNRTIALDDNKIIGECDYIVSEDGWNIVHTEVEETYKGQGIARQLVNCVLENARVKVKADCSYARRVIEEQ
jgi:predicted GNAT family acetyltransferase